MKHAVWSAVEHRYYIHLLYESGYEWSDAGGNDKLFTLINHSVIDKSIIIHTIKRTFTNQRTL